MLASLRAGIVAALVALSIAPTAVPAAAQKAFQRDNLNEAVIKLEAQIKSEAGQVTKSLAELRRDADAAFAMRLLKAHGVASIPTSAFLYNSEAPRVLRFCFAWARRVRVERGGSGADGRFAATLPGAFDTLHRAAGRGWLIRYARAAGHAEALRKSRPAGRHRQSSRRGRQYRYRDRGARSA